MLGLFGICLKLVVGRPKELRKEEMGFSYLYVVVGRKNEFTPSNCSAVSSYCIFYSISSAFEEETKAKKMSLLNLPKSILPSGGDAPKYCKKMVSDLSTAKS